MRQLSIYEILSIIRRVTKNQSIMLWYRTSGVDGWDEDWTI